MQLLYNKTLTVADFVAKKITELKRERMREIRCEHWIEPSELNVFFKTSQLTLTRAHISQLGSLPLWRHRYMVVNKHEKWQILNKNFPRTNIQFVLDAGGATWRILLTTDYWDLTSRLFEVRFKKHIGNTMTI